MACVKSFSSIGQHGLLQFENIQWLALFDKGLT